MSVRGTFRKALSITGAAALAGGLLLTVAGTAGATTTYPEAFTGAGITVTGLTPACAQAIAATPGSDPAEKVINTSAANSYAPGGTVNYTYTDNGRAGSTFEVQDCLVVYPSDFFSSGDFSANGVLTGDYTKHDLTSTGTEVDGATLSGAVAANQLVNYAWTVPSSVTAGSWVCNFARDVGNNHAGDGNRKVSPVCFQVPTPPLPGQVTINKVSDPAGQSFGFSWSMTGGATASGTFAIIGGAPSSPGTEIIPVPSDATFPVTVTVQEDAPTGGWVQGTAVCTVSGGVETPSTATTATGVGSFSLYAGQSASCTFTNTLPPSRSITVVKQSNVNGDFGFQFSRTGEDSPSPTDFTLTVPGGSNNLDQRTFTDLGNGQYQVTEDSPGANWSQTASCQLTGGAEANAQPSSGDNGASALVFLGTNNASAICTFVNTYSAPFTPVIPTYAITISKTGPALAHVGDLVTYNMAVRATTNYGLTNVKVTDPECVTGPTLVSKVGGDQDNILAPNETWNYTCTRTVLPTDSNPFLNTATATSDQATASATHLLGIIHPSVTVTKTANPTSGTPGTSVVYTYTVTNTGDTTLLNITVSDDHLGSIGTAASLDPGASITFTKTFTLGSSSVTNTVVAQGADVLGQQVSATAQATVTAVSGAVIVNPTTTTPAPTTTTSVPPAPPAATPVKTLPFTGAANAVRDLAGGSALMVGGSLLLWAGRRRRSADKEA